MPSDPMDFFFGNILSVVFTQKLLNIFSKIPKTNGILEKNKRHVPHRIRLGQLLDENCFSKFPTNALCGRRLTINRHELPTPPLAGRLVLGSFTTFSSPSSIPLPPFARAWYARRDCLRNTNETERAHTR